MNTNLFLIDLYNLHLPDEPSSEVKQNLTKTIWKHHKCPWWQVMGDKIEKKEISITWPDKYSSRVMIIAGERHFEIKPDYLGYQSSDVDWWLSDYPSFLEEYNRLRSFVDDYIEGKFNTKNYVWLNEALTRFPYGLYIDVDSRVQISLVELGEARYSREKSDKIMEIDINRVNIGFCFNQSKMTANEVILAPAYIEIIDLIRTKTVHFGKCKRNGCNNIFLKARRRKYCSDECSYEAKLGNDREGVRQEATKVYKTLCDLIDKWLKQDSRGITATELKKELKKIDNGSYKPGSIETPFLGGVTAKSLGRLLPQVEEKLKEKGILIEIKKRKKGYLYQFTQIKS